MNRDLFEDLLTKAGFKIKTPRLPGSTDLAFSLGVHGVGEFVEDHCIRGFFHLPSCGGIRDWMDKLNKSSVVSHQLVVVDCVVSAQPLCRIHD